MEKELQPFHSVTDKIGCTLMWDSWTNVANTPLENVIMANPKGAYFHSALEYEGEGWCLYLQVLQVSTVID